VVTSAKRVKDFYEQPRENTFPRRSAALEGGRRRAAAGFASDASRDDLARRHGIADEGTRESALFTPVNDVKEKKTEREEEGTQTGQLTKSRVRLYSIGGNSRDAAGDNFVRARG